jgi:membrane protease YdiL (CAAX protease family)
MAAAAGLPVAWLWWRLPAGPLFPPQRRRAIPWSGIEVTLAFLGVVLAQALVHSALPELRTDWKDLPEGLRTLWESLLTFPGTLAVAFLVPRRMSGACPYQMGLTTHAWRRHLVTGYLTWLLVALPVWLLHLACVWAYREHTGTAPPHHVLMEVIKAHPRIGVIVLVVLSAVVTAPVAEEFLFRGLLQPFLCRSRWGPYVVATAALALATQVWNVHGWGPAVFVALVSAALPFVEWLAWRALPAPGVIPAIYATSLLFAIMHAPVWPTPVPLFVLSLGLGFLAYRTQSLVGPVLVHALFNAISCGLLLYGVLGAGAGKGKETTSAVGPPSPAATAKAVPGS